MSQLDPNWIRVGLEVLTLIISLFSAAFVAAQLVGKQFTARMEERFRTFEEKFTSLEASAQREVDQWRAVDRDLLMLKADLPLQYVRREDYIRNQAVIEMKIDALAMKIEQLPKGTPNVRT